MLHKYTLGLNRAGHVDYVLGICAKNLHKAKNEWARLLGFGGELWDEKTGTYFGWPVVQTNQEPLQRKSNPNPFQY